MAVTPEQRARAGQAVAQRMLLRGVSAQTLAAVAGVHPRTVRRLMRGERWPTLEVRNAIEAALDWKTGSIVRQAIDGMDTLDGYSDSDLAAELLRRAQQREEIAPL